jgi:histidinol-phosphate aminotransferase
MSKEKEALKPRDSYSRLSLYSPDRSFAQIDLSDNTNRWGMPPAAESAVRNAALELVTRYPQVYADSLKQALATYIGTDIEHVVTGCGSDDVLDSAIRAFGQPGDRIAIPDPSFAMLPAFARMNELEPVLVPLDEDYAIDVKRMLGAQAKIIYICSPNNTTGTLESRSSIERLAAETDGLVIVDEAYAEFAGENSIPLLDSYPNVVIVRTMSKAFGLAGLRVGYAVGSPEVIAEVEKSRGPYKVNAMAAAAAIAALTSGMEWVTAHIALAVENRGRITQRLRELGLDATPSAANFVFVPIENASAIAASMRRSGVAVRPFSDLPLVSDALRKSGGSALRISVGPSEQIEAALAALETARRECA